VGLTIYTIIKTTSDGDARLKVASGGLGRWRWARSKHAER